MTGLDESRCSLVSSEAEPPGTHGRGEGWQRGLSCPRRYTPPAASRSDARVATPVVWRLFPHPAASCARHVTRAQPPIDTGGRGHHYTTPAGRRLAAREAARCAHLHKRQRTVMYLSSRLGQYPGTQISNVHVRVWVCWRVLLFVSTRRGKRGVTEEAESTGAMPETWQEARAPATREEVNGGFAKDAKMGRGRSERLPAPPIAGQPGNPATPPTARRVARQSSPPTNAHKCAHRNGAAAH